MISIKFTINDIYQIIDEFLYALLNLVGFFYLLLK